MIARLHFRRPTIARPTITRPLGFTHYAQCTNFCLKYNNELGMSRFGLDVSNSYTLLVFINWCSSLMIIVFYLKTTLRAILGYNHVFESVWSICAGSYEPDNVAMLKTSQLQMIKKIKLLKTANYCTFNTTKGKFSYRGWSNALLYTEF